MSKKGNDNKMYSATELARYQNGEMSAREMHALEKAALEDPLLANALEGFDNRSIPEVTKEIQLLKEKLAERIDGKKRRLAFPFYRVGIAAAVFLLAGSLSLIYFLNKSDGQERQVIVQQTPAVKQNSSPMQQKAAIQEIDSVNPVPYMQVKKPRRPVQKPLPNEEASVEKPEDKNSEPKPILAKPSPTAMASRQAFDTLNILEDNAMYKEKSRMLKQQVEKKADTSLQEVVVVGYGSQKKRTLAGSAPAARSIMEPKLSISPYGIDADKAAFSPVKGWTAFIAYFQKSVSQKTEWQNKHGEIVVRFRIDESGSAKDIRVEKSPDQNIDRETIRIISAGTGWTVNAGTERLVKILINF